MTATPAAPVYFLLVDDVDGNLLALEALLRRDGLVLLRARSGSEALELLLQYDVALALLDVQMPGMDGFELAELMRGAERTRRVPIIFLTAGDADRQRRFRGYEMGGVDFLLKPIESHILRSKADTFFELYRQRQEVAQQRDEMKAAKEEIARLLDESRRYADALKEADERKDEFMAMLAHELRNPLAPIASAVQVLKLAEPSDPAAKVQLSTIAAAREAREIIARQTAHMARLVDDLLDVARIARGKLPLRTERCDLASIVRDTTADYAAALKAAGLTLQLNLPDKPAFVSGDPIRLAQVVGNLLHNACKFTPSGGLVTVVVALDPEHDSAVVTVADTGAGLGPSETASIFEPFNQSKQSLDRSKGGLGLGLTLARTITELHRGTIDVTSAGIGKGSTFKIVIPLIPSASAEQGEPSSDASSTSPAPRLLKVLIVEDNQDAAKSLQMLLKFAGYDAHFALDGRSGLKAARDLKPDVIMSDLGLPGDTDGYALARTVRGDPELAPTYLIALSGYGHDEDRRRTKAAGFDHHLVKPVGLATVSELLLSATRRD
jgi:signal transduction histidine kinase